ncbi:MAG TPA: Fur family transcriptional regulator [Leptospiraceae bacterium]|nr:Fur family transcriptional regulator [Leptospiraceae bacterium]HMW05486.1 Fur family transcriptional regulator [Leptospiraceae bacterium]HMX35233.1 Fur family transcriptional regulator [Leptospiraceae bacterium]HMY30996.1 Fur family transcriptional regulator [Leptospiraceae bacterium]HMZ64390.1 Fur family transcriptional regulator [Leptospiraceae bacterium]
MKNKADKTKVNPEIAKEMEIFNEFLKKKDLKVTSQRMLVAETIFSIHQHFTADSLLELLKDHRDEISKATIYRILSIMVEAKLLAEHDFGKDFKYYEHIIGHEHHDHIICTDCGRIVEFVVPQIEDLQQKIAEEKGFTIHGHRLNIYGNCKKKPDCEFWNKKG